MFRLALQQMRGIILVGIVLLCIPADSRENFPQVGQGVDTDFDQAEWTNLPGAPLIFEVTSNKRSLLLINSSEQEIQEYRLACVRKPANNLKLIRKLPPRRVRLEAKVGMVLNPLPTLERVPKFCRSGTFVVWEVQFSDGKIWSAK
jgi:hypothetical protein